MQTQTTQFSRLKSPPRLKPATKSSEGSYIPLESAGVKEKDSFSWGKLALGLGLAGSALAGCANGAPVVEQPPEYHLESPEVVVMSESTHKIDISREQKEECFGFGAARECVTEDLAYHPVGLHLGEGIVQDLNGNLFAAPQLVGKDAPGVSVRSPQFLEAQTSYGAYGTLVEFSEGSYAVDGNFFGQGTINTREDGATVQTPGFFGPEEYLSIQNENGTATIREVTGQVSVLKSSKDHLSVENQAGETIATIRHDRAAGEYTVDLSGPYGDYQSSVSYNETAAVRKEDKWAVGEVSLLSAQGDLQMSEGPNAVLRTSVGEHGWTDQHAGPFGSLINYSFSRGR